LAALATIAFTLAIASALGAPAGASGFGPHDSGGASHPALRAHVVAPLTLANIVVTPLSSGNSTVASFATVATTPGGPGGAQCTSTASSSMCLSYGNPVSNGGQFIFSTGSFQPGGVYTEQNGSVSVYVTGLGGCVATANNGNVAAVEVDQYTFSAGQPTVAAVQFDCTSSTVDISGTIAYNIVPTDPQHGYYLFGQAGEIAGFGNDNYLDYLNGAQYYNLNAPIVGMAPTPDGGGYWMTGMDGGVFSSGDAGFYGSTGNLHLNKPVVGMAATPDGKGYWFVATDGGIFSYGDAQFYGSTGAIVLNKPVVGMAATPSGHGYWLVASDGGIFAYGDAQFYGSTGAIHLNQPVVGMTSTPSGHGYWFVAADGGIFAYGDAQFYGSTGSIHLNKPIVGMVAAPNGNGYWFVASDGGVFNYGSAGFAGSLGGSGVNDVAGLSLGL
jgi:ribosomal protein L24E